MQILISAARGKTGRHVIEALRGVDNPSKVRGLVRKLPSAAEAGVDYVTADLEHRRDVEAALDGVDVVVHYGPTLHPLESSMGVSMIDAAEQAGVRRFIYISVIHPQLDHLMNHQAKRVVESHLFNSSLDWTVLRPQHYMQNNDIRGIVAAGKLTVPYSVDTKIGHVDMRDLAEAVVIVAMNKGHSFASYDLDGGQSLSATDLAAVISKISGVRVVAEEVSIQDAVEGFTQVPLSVLPKYTSEGFYRLFGFYSRIGIAGNPNVATWLLGRNPGTFEQYVRRSLALTP
jgi:uncharacterized protein YbjT (DUF2867 family)